LNHRHKDFQAAHSNGNLFSIKLLQHTPRFESSGTKAKTSPTKPRRVTEWLRCRSGNASPLAQATAIDQGSAEMRMRLGWSTTKLPVSRSACLRTRSSIRAPTVDRAPAGNRINTTPTLLLPAANTSCPKSLSSVSRIRQSRSASAITPSSSEPAKTSATDTTSKPSVRSARTAAKSQLSSARKRNIAMAAAHYKISSWASATAA